MVLKGKQAKYVEINFQDAGGKKHCEMQEARSKRQEERGRKKEVGIGQANSNKPSCIQRPASCLLNGGVGNARGHRQ
ncbi:hypothetical protein SY88_12060 [Clostridiales bacterium PH28_bin88]|nr:hypothetical protein SY88_12060 [Clostridiales bacterium PH28_bin88]